MSLDEIREQLESYTSVPLWPDAAKILGGSKPPCRNSTYAAAQTGSIKTIRIGAQLRVPTSWLKAQLGLDRPTSAS